MSIPQLLSDDRHSVNPRPEQMVPSFTTKKHTSTQILHYRHNLIASPDTTTQRTRGTTEGNITQAQCNPLIGFVKIYSRQTTLFFDLPNEISFIARSGFFTHTGDCFHTFSAQLFVPPHYLICCQYQCC